MATLAVLQLLIDRRQQNLPQLIVNRITHRIRIPHLVGFIVQWFSTSLMLGLLIQLVPCVLVTPEPQNYFCCYFKTVILLLL